MLGTSTFCWTVRTCLADINTLLTNRCLWWGSGVLSLIYIMFISFCYSRKKKLINNIKILHSQLIECLLTLSYCFYLFIYMYTVIWNFPFDCFTVCTAILKCPSLRCNTSVMLKAKGLLVFDTFYMHCFEWKNFFLYNYSCHSLGENIKS